MFMGEYQHTIDTKGRLIVPAKFREELGDVFVITKGLDNCLFVYPYTEWKIFEEKLNLFVLSVFSVIKLSWVIAKPHGKPERFYLCINHSSSKIRIKYAKKY